MYSYRLMNGREFEGKAAESLKNETLHYPGSRHFILDISFGRGVNDGGGKPFASPVVPAKRGHVGACNKGVAGSIDFYCSDSYRQNSVQVVAHIFAASPFSTFDCLRRGENFKSVWLGIWGTWGCKAQSFPSQMTLTCSEGSSRVWDGLQFLV